MIGMNEASNATTGTHVARNAMTGMNDVHGARNA